MVLYKTDQIVCQSCVITSTSVLHVFGIGWMSFHGPPTNRAHVSARWSEEPLSGSDLISRQRNHDLYAGVRLSQRNTM